MDGSLQPIEPMNGWVSPRLGIRFEWVENTLRLLRPDGRALETYEEVDLRAEAERQRAEAERQRAEAAERRANELEERLRALGIESGPGEARPTP